jgi:ABC-type transport system substrate-binding protein
MIQPRTLRTLSRLAAIALALAIGGCGGARTQAPASAQPPVVPGEQTQGPDLSGVQLPNFVMPLIKGGVSLPNPKLTPGAVTTTSTNIVCNMPPHSTVPGLSSSVQTDAYTEYGDTSQSAQRKHILDWLVPYNLGGTDVLANIWPAAIRGIGFYEKIDTDTILRQMVCRRELTLTQAQQALEKNWYSAWLRYVVGTGHI